ncbi:thioredoxin-dependent thiol peroxidase [Candidatus Kaiserbacteria bacterium]|nr:thioredoxin-dependent thiol peroxidase [Candidatus Kaiserbacteria bacterium]
MLVEKDIAPKFTLLDQGGQKQSLSAQKGKWVLIYFYPKDDTPGCTKEACTIAEVYNDFSKMGVTVFGVSKDSVASHKKFADKYSLPFSLLSDEEGKVIEAYGAWKEKSMFGKKYMGINRISYLINPKGKVEKVYPKVSPATHALDILKDLKSLIN